MRPPTARRQRRRADLADPSTAITPSAKEAAVTAKAARRGRAPVGGDELDAAILRFIRRHPNRTVDLGPLADELKLDPIELQLAVARLHARRMVVAPFIEPGSAGGATLTARGLAWLIAREGGKPVDTPAALQPATERVRAEDEAARLPRAQVYGVKQPG